LPCRAPFRFSKRESLKAYGVNIKVVEEETNVYADQLVTFFEKHTGLYLSL